MCVFQLCGGGAVLQLKTPFQVRAREQASLRCKFFFFYRLRRQVNICSAHSANSALDSPLSNRFDRRAGIVLKEGCPVANRVTDLGSESVNHGTRKITRKAGYTAMWPAIAQLV